MFFAFSTFVMGALGRLPAAHGIAAMQSINVVVINPLFLGVFIGTAGLCALLVAAALFTWQQPGAMLLLVQMCPSASLQPPEADHHLPELTLAP